MTIIEHFEAKTKDINYLPHKKFPGVYLKDLVKGSETQGRISCHLVRVDPLCALETHTHPEQLEIHEVIFGDGECQLAEGQLEYTVGTVTVIPQNTPHKVTAGKAGLYILVKFTPAILSS